MRWGASRSGANAVEDEVEGLFDQGVGAGDGLGLLLVPGPLGSILQHGYLAGDGAGGFGPIQLLAADARFSPTLLAADFVIRQTAFQELEIDVINGERGCAVDILTPRHVTLLTAKVQSGWVVTMV